MIRMWLLDNNVQELTEHRRSAVVSSQCLFLAILIYWTPIENYFLNVCGKRPSCTNSSIWRDEILNVFLKSCTFRIRSSKEDG